MGNVVLTVLSMTIGLFFILMGTLKITPVISEEVYRELRKAFIRSAKVFPFAEVTGFKPNAHTYRLVVACTEVVCGLLMAFIPGPLKEVANVILFCLMGGAVYTHYALGDGMDKMTPALVFGLLLGCRLIVHLQVRARNISQAQKKATQQKKEQ